MDNIPMRPADLIFPNRRQALASGVCHMSLPPFNICKGNGTASEFKDGLSRREYEISGMCQACQDDTFESDVMDGTDEEKLTECECDSTHKQNDTCCMFCWNNGQRRWVDAEECPYVEYDLNEIEEDISHT